MQSRPSRRIACRPVGSRCLPLKQGKRLQNNSFRRPHCRSCMTPFAFATHLFVAALSESNIAIASDYEEPVRKLSAAYLSAASPPTPLHRNLANADSLLRIAYASSSSGLRIRRAASSSLLQLHGCRIWPRQYSNSRTLTRCLFFPHFRTFRDLQLRQCARCSSQTRATSPSAPRDTKLVRSPRCHTGIRPMHALSQQSLQTTHTDGWKNDRPRPEADRMLFRMLKMSHNDAWKERECEGSEC